jgi:integrase
MVTRAFYEEKVDGKILKVFKPLEQKLKHGSNARKRILSFDEYLRLITHCPTHLKPIVTTAYYTGMRKGELLKLKWSHIDRKTGFIRLPARIVKERRDKNIPINEHVKDVLDSLPRSISHGFVFTYRGNYIEENGIKKSFKTACKEAGIPHGTKTKNGLIFHDIRRTVKTNMVEAGVDKVHRDLILGHSLKGMDVYYMAPTEKTLAEAMTKYTEWADLNFETISANVTQTVTQSQS